jgi:hypothetical protein
MRRQDTRAPENRRQDTRAPENRRQDTRAPVGVKLEKKIPVPVMIASTITDDVVAEAHKHSQLVASTITDDASACYDNISEMSGEGYLYKKIDDVFTNPTGIEYGKVLPIVKRKTASKSKRNLVTETKQVALEVKEEGELSETDRKICDELYGDL